MKFNVKGNKVKIFVNKKEQVKIIKKARLSDKGRTINEVVEEFLRKKKEDHKKD